MQVPLAGGGAIRQHRGRGPHLDLHQRPAVPVRDGHRAELEWHARQPVPGEAHPVADPRKEGVYLTTRLVPY